MGPGHGRGDGRGGGRGSGGPPGQGCEPPPAPGGLSAGPGGGSSEVLLTWDPLPVDVGSYRVYRQRGEGTWWLLAVVSADVRDSEGRVWLVDAPDYWPWPSGADPSAERCYAVSVLAQDGLEGPMSSPACAVPL